MDVTGLSEYFRHHLYSAYDVNSWKPEPDLFLHAANQLELQPSECLVVEDSEVGVDGAIAANMKAVLYDPKGVHDDYYERLSEDSKSSVLRVTHFSGILTAL